jgi:basic membrane lipoprotein Med (substrate-binding protein (PBP1-ABC) superfamily)
MGPENVLTSVTWNLAPLIKAVGQTVIDGTWESKGWSFGIAEGSVELAPYHGLETNIPADVLEKVNAKFEAIKAGEFTVPHNTDPVE